MIIIIIYIYLLEVDSKKKPMEALREVKNRVFRKQK